MEYVTAENCFLQNKRSDEINHGLSNKHLAASEDY